MSLVLAFIGVVVSSVASGMATWATTNDPLVVTIGLFQVPSLKMGPRGTRHKLSYPYTPLCMLYATDYGIPLTLPVT